MFVHRGNLDIPGFGCVKHGLAAIRAEDVDLVIHDSQAQPVAIYSLSQRWIDQSQPFTCHWIKNLAGGYQRIVHEQKPCSLVEQPTAPGMGFFHHYACFADDVRGDDWRS